MKIKDQKICTSKFVDVPHNLPIDNVPVYYNNEIDIPIGKAKVWADSKNNLIANIILDEKDQRVKNICKLINNGNSTFSEIAWKRTDNDRIIKLIGISINQKR